MLISMATHTQNLVTHVWISLDAAEKAELRHFLMDHLISCHTSLPPFIRNKLIKVLVYVGRADWPHQYPEFFSHVLQVGQLRLLDSRLASYPRLFLQLLLQPWKKTLFFSTAAKKAAREGLGTRLLQTAGVFLFLLSLCS